MLLSAMSDFQKRAEALGLEAKNIGDSPLDYPSGFKPQRFVLIEKHPTPSDALTPPFAPTIKKILRSPSGRTLKKPQQIPVAGAPPGTLAFIDWHPTLSTAWSGIFIDYLSVRRDRRNQGLASLITHLFFEQVVLPSKASVVDWGKMMDPAIGRLKTTMEIAYPNILEYGKVYY